MSPAAPLRAEDPEHRNHRLATQLLNGCMAYARLILRRYGELAPFGFSMDREGQIARETLELPRLPGDPARLWNLLAEHIAERARRRFIEAAALAANVSLAQPSAEGYTDAVILHIEHESGYSIEVTVPYRIYGGHFRNVLPRRVALGKMTLEDAAARIFSRSEPR